MNPVFNISNEHAVLEELARHAWDILHEHVEVKTRELRDLIGELYDHVQWMSGSSDFSAGGPAHEAFKKYVRPTMDKASEVLRPDRHTAGSLKPVEARPALNEQATEDLTLSVSNEDWKTVAMKAGEIVGRNGPPGYYFMTPDEWLEWFRNEINSRSLALSDEGIREAFADIAGLAERAHAKGHYSTAVDYASSVARRALDYLRSANAVVPVKGDPYNGYQLVHEGVKLSIVARDNTWEIGVSLGSIPEILRFRVDPKIGSMVPLRAEPSPSTRSLEHDLRNPCPHCGAVPSFLTATPEGSTVCTICKKPLSASSAPSAMAEATPVHSEGAERILKERTRQLAGKGFDARHDAAWAHQELLEGARSYLVAARSLELGSSGLMDTPPSSWPWSDRWWKPSQDPIRDLEKAGALIAAEIDRLIAKEMKHDAR